MTIVWDDDGDGTVYDHNHDAIGTISTETYVYPDDIQELLTEVWEQEANVGNSPLMSAYAGELLVRKIDGDIERTSEGASVP